MLAEDVMDCPVLVIGRGGVDVRVAGSHYGDTVQVSKILVGKRECTTTAECGFNAVMREEDA